jgi:hypothetical protein
MPPPFRKVPSTVRLIQTPPSTVGRIDPAKVASALGAEPTGERVPHAGPLTLYALRSELYRRQTSASRAAAAETDQPGEVPVSGQDWVRLKALASELSGPNAKPSPSQIGSILLSLALDTVKPVGESNGELPDPALTKKLAEKVAGQT